MGRRKTGADDDWRVPFVQLKKDISSWMDRKRELYHGVFVTGPTKKEVDVSPVVSQFDAADEFPLIQRVPICVGSGLWQHHCFFGKEPESLQKLMEWLTSLEKWIRKAPRGLVPIPTKPNISDFQMANVLNWLHIVYYLARKYKEHYLQADLLYSYSYTDFDDHIELWGWESCPASQVFDAQPMITTVPAKDHPKDQPLRHWKTSCEVANVQAPALLFAELETGVLEASMSAVVALKYYADAPDSIEVNPERERQRQRDRRGKKGKGARHEPERDKELLKAALRTWHLPSLGEFRQAAATIPELKNLLDTIDDKWSRSRVSRTMKALLHGNGDMTTYRRICDNDPKVLTLFIEADQRQPRREVSVERQPKLKDDFYS